jgi:hypothetical protein
MKRVQTIAFPIAAVRDCRIRAGSRRSLLRQLGHFWDSAVVTLRDIK